MSESKASPIDGSSLEVSLSENGITPGEISTLVLAAATVLDKTGVKSHINGIPAKVSEVSVPVEVDGKMYFARAAQFKKDPVNKKQQTLPFVVFDETPDVEVVTPNVRAVRFQVFGSHISLVAGSESNPLVDDAEQVKTVKSILFDLLDQSGHKSNARTLQRQQRIREVRNTIVYFGERGGAAVAAVAVAAAGGWFLLKDVDWSEIADGPGTPFDERGLELDGGNAYGIGERGAPEYSEELFSSEDLSQDNVPDLRIEARSQHDNPDDTLHEDENLRDVVITSSEEGKNCVTLNTERLDRDAEIVAWTDFTGPNGEDRSSELELIHRTDEFEICWNGQERNDNDDPRVVVDLRPGSK